MKAFTQKLAAAGLTFAATSLGLSLPAIANPVVINSGVQVSTPGLSVTIGQPTRQRFHPHGHSGRTVIFQTGPDSGVYLQSAPSRLHRQPHFSSPHRVYRTPHRPTQGVIRVGPGQQRNSVRHLNIRPLNY